MLSLRRAPSDMYLHALPLKHWKDWKPWQLQPNLGIDGGSLKASKTPQEKVSSWLSLPWSSWNHLGRKINLGQCPGMDTLPTMRHRRLALSGMQSWHLTSFLMMLPLLLCKMYPSLRQLWPRSIPVFTWGRQDTQRATLSGSGSACIMTSKHCLQFKLILEESIHPHII